MAKRTVFIFEKKSNKVFSKTYEFGFHKGGTLVSNRKSIAELHQVIRKDGYKAIAEVSRSSVLDTKPLREDTVIRSYYIYAIPRGGDLKSKMRYDTVYIKGLLNLPESKKLAHAYSVFTDLAYHGDRYNSSARSLALYRYLEANKLLEKYLDNPSDFEELYSQL